MNKTPCPFCDQPMAVLHKEAAWTTKTSHSAAAGTKTSPYRTPEKYEALEGHCGHSKRETTAALNGDMPAKILSREENLRKLQDCGLAPILMRVRA